MSHCLDAVCEKHRVPIGGTGCPERDCKGEKSPHGSIYVPCSIGCPGRPG